MYAAAKVEKINAWIEPEIHEGLDGMINPLDGNSHYENELSPSLYSVHLMLSTLPTCF